MLRLYSSKALDSNIAVKAIMSATALNATMNKSADIIAGHEILHISGIKTCILRYAIASNFCERSFKQPQNCQNHGGWT